MFDGHVTGQIFPHHPNARGNSEEPRNKAAKPHLLTLAKKPVCASQSGSDIDKDIDEKKNDKKQWHCKLCTCVHVFVRLRLCEGSEHLTINGKFSP